LTLLYKKIAQSLTALHTQSPFGVTSSGAVSPTLGDALSPAECERAETKGQDERGQHGQKVDANEREGQHEDAASAKVLLRGISSVIWSVHSRCDDVISARN